MSDAGHKSTGPLLLVESSAGSRAGLQRVLTAQGFEVTAVAGLQRARAAVAQQRFTYVVINLRLGDGYGLALLWQFEGEPMGTLMRPPVTARAGVMLWWSRLQLGSWT